MYPRYYLDQQLRQLLEQINNPILNLGLVKGMDGINGSTPAINIGNVIALPYGTYPYANITGTTVNPL